MLTGKTTANLRDAAPLSPWTPVCVAVCASAAVMLGCLGDEVRRERGASRVATSVSVAAFPMAVVTFTAAPVVTSPTASVSRFALEPLPLVATVVAVRLLDEVVLSRLGGRHGP